MAGPGLSTTRTTSDNATDHAADHNTAHGYVNKLDTTFLAANGGDTLIYDAATGTYKPGAAPSGGSSNDVPGVVGDGTTDNSTPIAAAYSAAAAAIDASQSAYFGSNRRGKKVIQLPAGTFKIITPGALMSDLGIPRAQGLTIRGVGRDMTSIVFSPASANQYLMDNNEDWLNITFEDLSFHSTVSTASFMRSYSTGGPQNYVFNRVNWTGSWKYGVDMQGTNVNSEMSWFHCGFYDNWTAFLYTSSSGSDQFLNYNFYACNPEMDTGNFVDLAKGGNVNVYGGSYIHRGDGSVDQTFFKLRGGDHSSGVMRLYVNGIRVEHHHIKSHLIESEWKRGSVTFESIDTESHAFLLGSASTLPQATFQGDPDALPQVMFRDCVGLFGKHSYQFNSGSWNRHRQITYENCEFPLATSAHDFITIVNNGSTSNVGGTPPILFTNCRSLDSAGGNPYLYAFDCTVGWELAKNATPERHQVSIKTADGSLPNVAAGAQDVWLPKNAVIINVRFYKPSGGSSTSTTWTYTIKTTEGTPTTVATANPGTAWNAGFSVNVDTWFLCDTDAKRHIQLAGTVITELSTASLCVLTYIA